MANASALNAMLSGLPLAINEELDPGAAHQQLQGPLGPPMRNLDDEHSMGLRGSTGATVQSRSTIFSRLAVRRREPSYVLVQSDQKRPAIAERNSIAGPVRRAVASG
jgi:hypothetical protein